MNNLIIGCGYVGCRLAPRLDGPVLVLTHSPERVTELESRGWRVLTGNLDQAESLAGMPLAGSCVYYLAPPPPRGEEDSRMGHFCDQLTEQAAPARIVLISTTGVYGDCGDDWVDEGRPVKPGADRARRRTDAENRLLECGQVLGIPIWILRVPGIYGPGRLPVERLRKGLPVLAEQDCAWSNRVHVDDLVRSCIAAGTGRGEPGIYNISDGNPSTMTDYFNRVADAAGLPRPPQISWQQARREMSEGMLSYLAESKRLSNRRMREVLGVEPVYTDLDVGLAACLNDD